MNLHLSHNQFYDTCLGLGSFHSHLGSVEGIHSYEVHYHVVLWALWFLAGLPSSLYLFECCLFYVSKNFSFT